MKKSTLFLFSFLILLSLSGCGPKGVETKADTTPEVADVENADDETTSEDHAAISLQLACIPNESTKDNKLQNVVVTIGDYLSGELTPIPSYDLSLTNDYLLVAEVAIPDYSEDAEYDGLLQSERLGIRIGNDCSFSADSQITTFSCNASLVSLKKANSFSSNNGDLQKAQKASALFCGNDDNVYTIAYLCSVSVTADGVFENFIDCDYLKGSGSTSNAFFTPDAFNAPGKIFVVYEVKKVADYAESESDNITTEED